MADQAELPQRSLKSVFEEALRCYNEIDSGNVIPSEQQVLFNKKIDFFKIHQVLVHISKCYDIDLAEFWLGVFGLPTCHLGIFLDEILSQNNLVLHLTNNIWVLIHGTRS